jgi:hypothetical protein
MTSAAPEQAKTETLARLTDPGSGHINCAQAVVHFALLVFLEKTRIALLPRAIWEDA